MKKEVLVAAAIASLFSSLAIAETKAVGAEKIALKEIQLKKNGAMVAPKQIQHQIKSGQDLKAGSAASDAYNAIGCTNDGGCTNKKCGAMNGDMKIPDASKIPTGNTH